MATKKTSDAGTATALAVTATAEAPKSTLVMKVNLPCRLRDFFMYCRLAWGYCRDHLTTMAAESPRFTNTFIDDQLDKVDLVENLPTLASRIAAASTAHVQLQTDNQVVLSLAQRVKNFILYAFKDKVVADIQLRAAGLTDYSFAADGNWGSTANMIIAVNQYLAAHLTELTAGGNMPPTFPATFTAAGVTFNASWADFIDKEKLSKLGTGTQEEGLQEILDELNPMLQTGRRAFEYEPLVRQEFTTSWLLDQVRGNHPSGVEGTVKLASTNQPKSGVLVSVEGDAEKFAITDEDGKYELRVASGVYTLVFTSEDTLPFTVLKRKVRVGVMGRLSVTVEPVPEEVVAIAEPAPSEPAPAKMEATASSLSEKRNGVLVE